MSADDGASGLTIDGRRLTAAERASCFRRHAARRARERHGLSPADLAAAEATVRAAKSPPGTHPHAIRCVGAKSPPWRECWAVRPGDRWIPVVYDVGLGVVVTVLPARVLGPVLAQLEGRPAPPGPGLWTLPRRYLKLARGAEIRRIEGARAAARAAIRAAHRRLDGMRKDHPDRPAVVAEIERLRGRVAEIKAELAAAHRRLAQGVMDGAPRSEAPADAV